MNRWIAAARSRAREICQQDLVKLKPSHPQYSTGPALTWYQFPSPRRRGSLLSIMKSRSLRKITLCPEQRNFRHQRQECRTFAWTVHSMCEEATEGVGSGGRVPAHDGNDDTPLPNSPSIEGPLPVDFLVGRVRACRICVVRFRRLACCILPRPAVYARTGLRFG